MKKRQFTDVNKWELEEFRELPASTKLLSYYMNDKCDIAGFLQYSPEYIAFNTKLSVEEIGKAFKDLESTYIKKGNWIWLRDYAKTQKYLPLNPHNNVHKGVFRCIEEHQDDFDIDEILKILKTTKGDYLMGIQKVSKGHSMGIEKGLDGSRRGTGIGLGVGKGKESGKGEVNLDNINNWDELEKQIN